VAGDLGVAGDRRARGRVVKAADEARDLAQLLVGCGSAVEVLRDLSVDVAQDQPFAVVEAEEARRAVEADLLEMTEERDDEGRPPERRLPDRVAGADGPDRREAVEWDLAYSASPSQ
jgi:hypothetical protein